MKYIQPRLSRAQSRIGDFCISARSDAFKWKALTFGEIVECGMSRRDIVYILDVLCTCVHLPFKSPTRPVLLKVEI